MLIYNIQKDPLMIIVLVVGLAGTEDSLYVKDIINEVDKNIMIFCIRGYETLENKFHKLFIKNDSDQIGIIMSWLRKIYVNKIIIGVGVSLGGSLVLRHQSKGIDTFDRACMISTSLWYEHAIQTMHDTIKGTITNKLIALWQFRCLFWNTHYLSDKLSWKDYIDLFVCGDLLEQDKILCKYYQMNYREYIDSLDMRHLTKKIPCVDYLISINDPMFSKEHIEETKKVLKNSLFYYEISDIGSHTEFTRVKRNDYLIEFVNKTIEKATQRISKL
jgi:predicted alpha/beta-fold hydrolase